MRKCRRSTVIVVIIIITLCYRCVSVLKSYGGFVACSDIVQWCAGTQYDRGWKQDYSESDRYWLCVCVCGLRPHIFRTFEFLIVISYFCVDTSYTIWVRARGEHRLHVCVRERNNTLLFAWNASDCVHPFPVTALQRRRSLTMHSPRSLAKRCFFSLRLHVAVIMPRIRKNSFPTRSRKLSTIVHVIAPTSIEIYLQRRLHSHVGRFDGTYRSIHFLSTTTTRPPTTTTTYFCRSLRVLIVSWTIYVHLGKANRNCCPLLCICIR